MDNYSGDVIGWDDPSLRTLQAITTPIVGTFLVRTTPYLRDVTPSSLYLNIQHYLAYFLFFIHYLLIKKTGSGTDLATRESQG
jgi:hypothetical protein